MQNHHWKGECVVKHWAPWNQWTNYPAKVAIHHITGRIAIYLWEERSPVWDLQMQVENLYILITIYNFSTLPWSTICAYWALSSVTPILPVFPSSVYSSSPHCLIFNAKPCLYCWGCTTLFQLYVDLWHIVVSEYVVEVGKDSSKSRLTIFLLIFCAEAMTTSDNYQIL